MNKATILEAKKATKKECQKSFLLFHTPALTFSPQLEIHFSLKNFL